MTDRCEPPPEWRDVEWHWLNMYRGPHLARWNADRESWWALERGSLTLFQCGQAGYTYLAPCRPDDATERVRLEAENARLRAALTQIAESNPRSTIPWTHEVAADAYWQAFDRVRMIAKDTLTNA